MPEDGAGGSGKLPSDKPTGVLLSDQIEKYAKGGMIDPFDSKNLKPASYNLTLGDRYQKDGAFDNLSDTRTELEIRPHESVLIQTKETLKVPQDLIGRWSPRQTLIFEGLVFITGVHIDPGWFGVLWVPVYNLSKNPIKLQRGKPFGSIDFSPTTAYGPGCVPYKQGWSNASTPGSGLEDVRNDVEKFKGELISYQRRLDSYQSSILTVIGIIVAAVTIISASTFLRTPAELPFTDWTSAYLLVFIGLSITSFGISILSVYYSRHNLQERKIVVKPSSTK